MAARQSRHGAATAPGLAYCFDDGAARRLAGSPGEGRRTTWSGPSPSCAGVDYRAVRQGHGGQSYEGPRLHPERQGFRPVDGDPVIRPRHAARPRGEVSRRRSSREYGFRAGVQFHPEVSPPDPVGGAHSPRGLHRGDRGQEGSRHEMPRTCALWLKGRCGTSTM